MQWMNKMQYVIDYIESHILEEIEMQKVADEIDAPLFHLQRLFHILSGVTIKDYIRRRRLTLAAHEIVATNRSIIDTALKYGYESHASFTKAFTKLHGFAPLYAREKGVKLKAYPQLSFNISLKGAVSLDYKIKTIDQIRIVGKIRKTSTIDGQNKKDVPIFWEHCNKDGTIDALEKIIDNKGILKSALVGACVDFDDQQETLSYMIGVESLSDSFSDKFEERIIQSQTYAIFNADGPVPMTIQNVWMRIFTEWFPATNYVQVAAAQLEVYRRNENCSPDNCTCEIWIPVKLHSN